MFNVNTPGLFVWTCIYNTKYQMDRPIQHDNNAGNSTQLHTVHTPALTRTVGWSDFLEETKIGPLPSCAKVL